MRRAASRRSGSFKREALVSAAVVDVSDSTIASRWRLEGQADLERLARAGDDRRIGRIKLSDRNPGTCERVSFFGPWVGEFGWLLSRWQGGVRRDAQAQPSAYVIVMGDPGCHVLFEYADEYWCTPPFVARLGLTRDMTGWRDKESPRAQRALRAAIALELASLGRRVDVVTPRRYAAAEQLHVRLEPPSAAEVELASLLGGDAPRLTCLFPRRRAHNPAKNWPPESWTRLAEHLYRAHGYHVVVCGGDDDTAELGLESAWALDLTKIPLERRLGLTLASLVRADLAVASESGGCQLALLTGTPTVVMGGTKWKKRVTEEENYLRTPCVFLERPRYAHPYEAVEAAVASLITQLPARARRDEAPPLAMARPSSSDLAARVREHLDAEPVLAVLARLPHVPESDRRSNWFGAASYYPTLAALARAIRPSRVLEVGTRLGYGLVAFVHGHPGIERLLSVDDESQIAGSQALAEANLRSVAFEGNVELLVGDGAETLQALRRHERFDLIYLDADEGRDRTEASIRFAWSLLAPGGYLLVDDIDYVAAIGDAFEAQRARVDDAELVERFDMFRGLGVMRKAPLQPPLEDPVRHACAVCGGGLRRLPAHDGMGILHCGTCDLVQVDLSDPADQRTWLDTYLQDGRYHRERQLHGHASFIDRYLHDRQLAELRISNLIPHAQPPGRLLDVGCSNGALVKVAAEHGFDAIGIDIDPWVVQRARQTTRCEFVCCDSLGYDAGGRRFDVITAIDVFEHLPAPNEHLASLQRLLTPGGLVVLEMPDVDQGGLRRLGYEWKHFKPREHAFYYGSEHVRRLADAASLIVAGSFVPYPDRRVHLLRSLAR